MSASNSLLELVDVLKFAVHRKHPRNRRRGPGGPCMRRPSMTTGLPVADSCEHVAIAPTADHVEAFQSEAGRIDFRTWQAGARLVLAMFGQLLAEWSTAPRMSGSSGAKFPRAARGGGVAQNTIEYPRAAQNRRGDVLVPLAVTVNTLAIVSRPPRWLSGGSFVLAEFPSVHAGDACSAWRAGR